MHRLKTEGASAVTLDQLCLAAGRTRGSFYHHFSSIDLLHVAVAERWYDTHTESIAGETSIAPDPLTGLADMVKLTDEIEPALERGVRVLAMSSAAIASVLERADRRREEVLRNLLGRAYGLQPAEAASAARLLHALHQAAVMRSPEDIQTYTRSSIRHLVGWLPKGEAAQ